VEMKAKEDDDPSSNHLSFQIQTLPLLKRLKRKLSPVHSTFQWQKEL